MSVTLMLLILGAFIGAAGVGLVWRFCTIVKEMNDD